MNDKSTNNWFAVQLRKQDAGIIKVRQAEVDEEGTDEMNDNLWLILPFSLRNEPEIELKFSEVKLTTNEKQKAIIGGLWTGY